MTNKIDKWKPHLEPAVSKLQQLSKKYIKLTKERDKVEQDLKQLSLELQNTAGILKVKTLDRAISGALTVSNSLADQEISLNGSAKEIIDDCIYKRVGHHQHGGKTNNKELVREYLWDVFEGVS